MNFLKDFRALLNLIILLMLIAMTISAWFGLGGKDAVVSFFGAAFLTGVIRLIIFAADD